MFLWLRLVGRSKLVDYRELELSAKSREFGRRFEGSRLRQLLGANKHRSVNRICQSDCQ